MESSVLFKSPGNAAVVIDIPRSLEEAQVLPGQPIQRRIISVRAVETPWQIPEPKKRQRQQQRRQQQHVSSSAAAVAELMTLETVKSALEKARASYDGPWCLPRHVAMEPEEVDASKQDNREGSRKRKYSVSSKEGGEGVVPTFVPEQSHYLLGTVESQRELFLHKAPKFDLIILDPPWPSRSVKRKSDSYGTVRSVEEASNLLSQIPVRSHLKRDGLVAIWVTNKAAITDALTSPTGSLAQWGLEPIGEWVWLKITSSGEPISDVESAWRKPWERLIIARERGNSAVPPIPTKVILGVPDLHSRKPNLRGLFGEFLPRGYQGLEVFARNLTAGWWSWGNEVLLFQERDRWIGIEDRHACSV
ncbi:MT-A70-domain-containing protein [Poronia punctata]|nr:MT-A70-domain-containing protein [Poronia punctata]